MFEIGNSLREARTRQGLDIAHVELATKIRGKYLRAIEEEEFDALPPGTYVKGFLRGYAEFLGLDGQLYVDEYDSRFVNDGHVDAPKRPAQRARRPVDHSFERRAVLLGLVGVAALAALVIVAWKFGGGSGSTPNVLTAKSSPAPRGLVFSGAGTYVEVRRSATGPVLYQGTLRAGDLNAVPGQRFWIRVTHPNHLRLTLNGKIVSLPARRTLTVLVTPTRTALAH